MSDVERTGAWQVTWCYGLCRRTCAAYLYAALPKIQILWESVEEWKVLPLNLGMPGVPGVGIGTPRVALRLISDVEDTTELWSGGVCSAPGLMTKYREKNLK